MATTPVSGSEAYFSITIPMLLKENGINVSHELTGYSTVTHFDHFSSKRTKGDGINWFHFPAGGITAARAVLLIWWFIFSCAFVFFVVVKIAVGGVFSTLLGQPTVAHAEMIGELNCYSTRVKTGRTDFALPVSFDRSNRSSVL